MAHASTFVGLLRRIPSLRSVTQKRCYNAAEQNILKQITAECDDIKKAGLWKNERVITTKQGEKFDLLQYSRSIRLRRGVAYAEIVHIFVILEDVYGGPYIWLRNRGYDTVAAVYTL